MQLNHGWGMVSGFSDMSMDPGSLQVEVVQHTLHSGVVLFLDWLPTKAAESRLPKDVWFFRRSRSSSPRASGAILGRSQILRPLYVA